MQQRAQTRTSKIFEVSGTLLKYYVGVLRVRLRKVSNSNSKLCSFSSRFGFNFSQSFGGNWFNYLKCDLSSDWFELKLRRQISAVNMTDQVVCMGAYQHFHGRPCWLVHWLNYRTRMLCTGAYQCGISMWHMSLQAIKGQFLFCFERIYSNYSDKLSSTVIPNVFFGRIAAPNLAELTKTSDMLLWSLK